MSNEGTPAEELDRKREFERALKGDVQSERIHETFKPSEDRVISKNRITGEEDLLKETKLLRDTLDLLWNDTTEQRQLCEQLKQENEYLQDYISNLMTSSNVLDK